MTPAIDASDSPPPASRPFEGDEAIKELRRWLARDPDAVPQPPNQKQRKSVAPSIRALSFVFIFMVISAFSAAVIMFPDALRKSTDPVVGLMTPVIEGMSRPARPARLLVKSQKGFVNEPLPLGVSIKDASGSENVTLTGIIAGTNISAGTPLGLTGWRVTARDLVDALAYAPKDFVGGMDAAIKLRSVDNRLMESGVVRLEWIQKKEEPLAPRLDPSRPPPVVQPLDADEIALLENFLKHGDIASARLLLKRAANAGNAQAAFALGATFDPIFLAEGGFLGFAPDVAQARTWYQRAIELGSIEASRNLERLATMGK